MLNRFISLALLFVAIAIFATGAAFAGFQWVPPGSQQAAEKDPGDGTAAPNLTPVPGTQAPLAPIVAQPLMPAAPTTPATPVVSGPVTLPATAPMPVMNAQPMHVLQAPKNQQPQPQPAPLIKVTTVSAPPAQVVPVPPVQEKPAAAPASQHIFWNLPVPKKEEPVAPQQADIPVIYQPSMGEPVMAEPATGAPAPIAKPQISKKLVINPYPQKTTAMTMAPQAAQLPAETGVALAVADDSFTKVVGFGSDMPLALALQQIAPAEYIFSFGDNVNPGVNISWDGGGKPWNQVITDAIAPLGLEASIEGHVVHIKQSAASAAQQGAAVMPQAGDEEPQAAAADSTIHRDNVTDPGETPKKQPLSTPVASTPVPAEKAEAAIPAAASEKSAQIEAAKETPAIPLLPTETATTEDAKTPAAMPVTVRGIWEVRQGDSLRETFDAWSKKANVELVWNAAHDYTVDADMTVNDSFQTAVEAVVAQGVKADKPVVKLEGDGKTGRNGMLIVQDKS